MTWREITFRWNQKFGTNRTKEALRSRWNRDDGKRRKRPGSSARSQAPSGKPEGSGQDSLVAFVDAGRSRAFSWHKVTRLWNEKCGTNRSPASMRGRYYYLTRTAGGQTIRASSQAAAILRAGEAARPVGLGSSALRDAKQRRDDDAVRRASSSGFESGARRALTIRELLCADISKGEPSYAVPIVHFHGTITDRLQDRQASPALLPAEAMGIMPFYPRPELLPRVTTEHSCRPTSVPPRGCLKPQSQCAHGHAQQRSVQAMMCTQSWT